MKTTIDLPGDLFIEAKATAARRRTTLKELITRSLRREIGEGVSLESPLRSSFQERAPRLAGAQKHLSENVGR